MRNFLFYLSIMSQSTTDSNYQMYEDQIQPRLKQETLKILTDAFYRAEMDLKPLSGMQFVTGIHNLVYEWWRVNHQQEPILSSWERKLKELQKDLKGPNSESIRLIIDEIQQQAAMLNHQQLSISQQMPICSDPINHPQSQNSLALTGSFWKVPRECLLHPSNASISFDELTLNVARSSKNMPSSKRIESKLMQQSSIQVQIRPNIIPPIECHGLFLLKNHNANASKRQ